MGTVGTEAEELLDAEVETLLEAEVEALLDDEASGLLDAAAEELLDAEAALSLPLHAPSTDRQTVVMKPRNTIRWGRFSNISLTPHTGLT